MKLKCVINIDFHQDYLFHGRIIKWTKHIGFLTLAGMYPVVEGNHRKDLKKG